MPHRSLLAFALLSLALPARAQILPELTGEALREALVADYAPAVVLSSSASKDVLYSVIDSTTVDGTLGTAGLYTGFFAAFDCDPSCDPSQDVFNQPNENTQGINQEHVWPRARGAGSGRAETDLHHLFPTKVNVNSDRGNLPFGEIDDAQTTTWYVLDQNRSSPPPEKERDAWSELRDNVRFEPREEKKGDVARAMFYFYTMYGPDGTGQAEDAFFEEMKETLLAWHESDLPTAEEIARSERVANYQMTGSSEPAINPFVHDATLVERAYFPTVVSPVVYVSASAVGASTGQSWEDAFTSLQSALVYAEEQSDAVEAIWIAQGTYFPTQPGGRDATFRLRSGLALYGGFDGSETTREERDWKANKTILSGDLGTEEDFADNAYHVLTAENIDETVVLDGLTIREGRPDGGASPEITKAKGGGIYSVNSALAIRNSVITAHIAGNDIRGYGAGVYAEGSQVELENVVISDNSAVSSSNSLGAGMHICCGSTVDITESLFAGNRIGGPERGKGGGLYISESTVDIASVRFEDNGVAGVYATGGGLHCAGTCRIQASEFVRNTATNGGYGAGISVDAGSSTDVVNTHFIGNQAPGGAAMSAEGTLVLTNILVVGNRTTPQFQSGPMETTGGAGLLAFEGSLVRFNQATLTANAALEGKGGGAVRARTGSMVTASNVVLWGNSDVEVGQDDDAEILIGHAIVEGGYEGKSVLDADPLFARAPSVGDDGVWGTEDDDYGDLRLQNGSPAVDSGRSPLLPPDMFDLDGDGNTDEPLPYDLDGTPRVQGNAPDLGAYESPFAVASEPTAGIPLEDGLGTPYPNPAHTRATLVLSLAEARDEVRVAAFDVLGRRVAVLHDGPLAAGRHTHTLDGTALPAGVYLVRATAREFIETRRVVILR